MLSPEDISRVTDDVRFRQFVDKLLQAEKRRTGAPGSVEILTKDNTKDDGVDGWAELQLTNATASSELFPDDHVFYQLKLDIAPQGMRDSLDKAGPKARVGTHLKSGGHYVIVVGAALTLPQDDNLRKAVLEGLGLDSSFLPQVHTLSAARLCALARPHLDVYVELGLPNLGAAETMAEWHPRLVKAFRTAFESDEATKAVAESIRAAIASKTPLVCVVGPSGSGKSRTVYNALDGTPTLPVIHFATPALLFESELLPWLKRLPPTAIVVVDGCTTTQIQEIYQRTIACPSTVIAISEQAKIPPGVPRIDWRGPSTDALGRMIAKTCPKLTESECKWVVATCGRNPLMALQLGTTLEKTAPTERHKVLAMHEEERAIQLLPEGAQKLAVNLALFDKVGYRDDVANEFDDLARLSGLSPADARDIVADLVASELIQGQKYIALRPLILRAQLLKGYIRKRGSSASDLAAAISSLRGAFSTMPVDERIMGGMALAITAMNQPELANAVVGPKGLFANLEDLNERANTFRLQTLAEGAPEQVLGLLERLLTHASEEQLRALKEGRRGVVPALETIATDAQLFARATRLLLRLAITENEHWSNNAAGSFAELFSPAIGYLAPTNATGMQRIEFLAKAVEDPKAWQHVADAMRQLFSLHHVRTVSSDPTSRSNLPGWSPKTWGEVHDYVAAGWQLATRMMDVSPEIRDVAFEHIRNLYQYKTLRPKLAAWLEQSVVKDEEPRALDAVADILNYDRDELGTDAVPLQAVMDQVLAKGLRGRLLRYVVISPVHDEAGQYRSEPLDDILERIAKQAIKEATPEETRDFLVARKAARGWRFAFFIGKNDPAGSWWPALSHDEGYAKAYLQGLRQAHPTKFDDLVGKVPLTAAGCQALATSLQNAHDAGRLVKALTLHPENAAGIRIWPGKLKPSELSELVEILLSMPHAGPRKVGLETALLYGQEKGHLVLTRSAALAVIGQNPGSDNDVHEVSLYSWSMLASALAKAHPDTVNSILDRIEKLAENLGMYQRDELARLVQVCASSDLDAVRSRLAAWLKMRGLHLLVGALLSPDHRPMGPRQIDESVLVDLLMTLPPQQAVAALNVIQFSWPGSEADREAIEQSAIARIYARFKDAPGIDSAVFNSLSRSGWGDPADADRRASRAYREMAEKISTHPFADWLRREADRKVRSAEWWDQMKEDENWV